MAHLRRAKDKPTRPNTTHIRFDLLYFLVSLCNEILLVLNHVVHPNRLLPVPRHVSGAGQYISRFLRSQRPTNASCHLCSSACMSDCVSSWSSIISKFGMGLSAMQLVRTGLNTVVVTHSCPPSISFVGPRFVDAFATKFFIFSPARVLTSLQLQKMQSAMCTTARANTS